MLVKHTAVIEARGHTWRTRQVETLQIKQELTANKTRGRTAHTHKHLNAFIWIQTYKEGKQDPNNFGKRD